MLTLSSISISVARPLIGDYAAANHTEGATILALASHLLQVLIVLNLARLAARWQGDNSASALHRTHGQL